jgi:hypothetical protein
MDTLSRGFTYQIVCHLLHRLNCLSLDREHHQEALLGLKKAEADEAKLTALLGHHFLSQLIPGKNYVIDNRSENLPTVCPCQLKDCNQKIQIGCTTLGMLIIKVVRSDSEQIKTLM